jgi:hypothetical protein
MLREHSRFRRFKGWRPKIFSPSPGDRERGGEKWLKWPEQEKVGYGVRIKKNILLKRQSPQGTQ